MNERILSLSPPGDCGLEWKGVILCDHGSGSINGVCFEELNDDESLYLKDIESVLGSGRWLLPNGFDFIGFDARLMSTLENTIVLAPYARYKEASAALDDAILSKNKTGRRSSGRLPIFNQTKKQCRL